jgi:hypothetical protein
MLALVHIREWQVMQVAVGGSPAWGPFSTLEWQ